MRAYVRPYAFVSGNSMVMLCFTLPWQQTTSYELVITVFQAGIYLTASHARSMSATLVRARPQMTGT